MSNCVGFKGGEKILGQKILIVEDNAEIASLIQLHLKDINCDADICQDGLQGLQQCFKTQYDLIILDLMLPSMDGLEFCKQLREKNNLVSIIMLTSKSSELDRVLGLQIGADDYLTKPFSFPELMARVKAQFRRQKVSQNTLVQQKIIQSELIVEVDKRKVTLKNKPLDLTAKEFDLLFQLISSPGRVYSRAELLDKVWGYHFEGYEHTVNSHINRLRGKLEVDPTKPTYLLTVWGVGYKFNEELL